MDGEQSRFDSHHGVAKVKKKKAKGCDPDRDGDPANATTSTVKTPIQRGDGPRSDCDSAKAAKRRDPSR